MAKKFNFRKYKNFVRDIFFPVWAYLQVVQVAL